MKVIELNDDNFDLETKSSAIPVLIDFYAIWCEACQKQLLIFDELTKEFAGKVKIAKINIDKSKIKSVEYGVSSVPGMFIFKNGEVVEHLIGLHTKKQLSEILNKIIS